ncbi:hypothetical protein TNCT_445031 [Trichonephila clavata]|uniref:Uncharacterized protein n=1 Tax=Trichonephila clavata TaxID=2740835 RepID=A0A8X6FKA7_TRICU|nr:hypothetical protein TNCT_445031 [Trichonephila clavata]
MRSPNKGPQESRLPEGTGSTPFSCNGVLPVRIRASRAGIAATVQCRGATECAVFDFHHRAVGSAATGSHRERALPLGGVESNLRVESDLETKSRESRAATGNKLI